MCDCVCFCLVMFECVCVGLVMCDCVCVCLVTFECVCVVLMMCDCVCVGLVMCEFLCVCLVMCYCVCGFCNVGVFWQLFGCFVKMCTCVYCVFVNFLNVFLFLFVTSVRTNATEGKLNWCR